METLIDVGRDLAAACAVCAGMVALMTLVA
jgi:hypothetical protein